MVDNDKEEYILKDVYEQMETIKLEQDNYVADVLKIQSKKLKELEKRIKVLEKEKKPVTL